MNHAIFLFAYFMIKYNWKGDNMQKITKDILENLDIIRDKINEDVEYMILKYDNLNSNDHWSCLCSAMDWIDVAKNNIDNEKINMIDFNLMWKDVYAYLSSIDIITEAISQIYRVIFEVPKERDIFNNSRSIFKGNYLEMTDYDFFKHLRAIFGAHPVKVSEDGVYKFASWPSSKKMGIGKNDISVHLYSSNKENSIKEVGFDFLDINKFLKKYIVILPKIYKQIDVKKIEFTNFKKTEIISRVDNPIEQIDILEYENMKRFNSDYIEEILNNLKIIFSTQITNDKNKILVNKYKELLEEGIQEIYNVLQNMNFEDLKVYQLLNPKYDSAKGFGYAYGKITGLALSTNYSYPFDFIKNDIEEKIIVNMEVDYFSIKELYVLLLTSLYFQQK